MIDPTALSKSSASSRMSRFRSSTARALISSCSARIRLFSAIPFRKISTVRAIWPISSPLRASGSRISKSPSASACIFDATPRIRRLMLEPVQAMRAIAGRTSASMIMAIFPTIDMKSARISSMNTPVPMKMFQGSKPLTYASLIAVFASSG